MNTVGPYYRFGVQVLDACIEAKCNYLDINDDWEPTLAMLTRHKEAKKAGITAVLGVGASPGISSMLAVKAINELDKAEEIYTGWNLDYAKPEKIGPEATSATVHGIHQLTGSIQVYRDGKYVTVKPVRKIKLDYPGFGRHPAWTVGHPEAITLPQYFPSLFASTNVMTTSRLNILGLRFIALLVNSRIMSVKNAAHIAEKIEGEGNPDFSPEKIMQKLLKKPDLGLPPLFALAIGTKNNQKASVGAMLTSAPNGGMGAITGIPLAVGVVLIGQNKINKPGVFAAEGIIEPDEFFNELAVLCEPEKRDVNDLVFVTRSFEKTDVREKLRFL